MLRELGKSNRTEPDSGLRVEMRALQVDDSDLTGARLAILANRHQRHIP